jgi:hypothetical protein
MHAYTHAYILKYIQCIQCIHVCMHAYTHRHGHIHHVALIRTHTHINMRVHTCAYTCTCPSACAQTCKLLSFRKRICRDFSLPMSSGRIVILFLGIFRWTTSGNSSQMFLGSLTRRFSSIVSRFTPDRVCGICIKVSLCVWPCVCECMCTFPTTWTRVRLKAVY